MTPESGCREQTVEVTTDTAAKRGLAVSPEAWQGWLYSNGQATLCSHQVTPCLRRAGFHPGSGMVHLWAALKGI